MSRRLSRVFLWLRYCTEAAVVGMIFLFARSIPLVWASWLGGRIGRTLGPWVPRSRVARDNLRLAFPDKTHAEIETIVRGMWDNLGRAALEYCHLDKLQRLQGGHFVEVVGVEHLHRMRDDGEPGLMFSAHLANWELLGPLAAMSGLALNLVYREPNNPLMGWLFRLRQAADAEMLPKGPDGARRMLRLLQEGCHVAMLVDQKMNDGIAIPFFGRDAMTAPALAQFALRFRCPVLPARIERLGGARFRITVFPPLAFEPSGDRQTDVVAIMTKVNTMLEEWIRERPEQWLWLHRRWPKNLPIVDRRAPLLRDAMD